MGWVSDLAAQLRRIMLMDEKVDRLGAEVTELRRDLRDPDRCVVRIEAPQAGRRRVKLQNA